MYKSLLVLLCSACLALSAKAQTPKNLDLYILAGQSNMAGRGPVTGEMKNEGNDHVFMFTQNGDWVLARHPLHFDKPRVAAAGPGLMFAIKIAEADPKTKIGLIPCAVGGTPIENWEPGAYDEATKTHPYDDAVARIKAAMAYGTIKGILWHQGESNSSPERSKDYLEKLIILIARLREVCGDKNIPFIAGELGRYRKSYDDINKQLAMLPAKVAFTALATSEGLVHKGDTTHFDGKSADELGRRYAIQMLKVQKQLAEKN